jgi:hypothetical protein
LAGIVTFGEHLGLKSIPLRWRIKIRRFFDNKAFENSFPGFMDSTIHFHDNHECLRFVMTFRYEMGISEPTI